MKMTFVKAKSRQISFNARKRLFVDLAVAGNNFPNVVIRIEFAMVTL